MDAKFQKTDKADVPFRVGVWALPGFALMSYACVVEPLRAANLLARRRLYDVVHFGAARASSGAEVAADAVPGAVVPVDLLLVVAGGDPFGGGEAGFGWLRQMDRAGVRIGGVSGGSVILARAGLMAGRRMTVHWEHAAALAERFPDLLIERRLYVIDRDRVTCGGGTAPLDLMHALIAGAHGDGFARQVTDWFLHTDIRAGGAPQRAGPEARLGVTAPPVLVALAAMEDHVGDPLTLAQLALIAGVSARQLNRLFGTTLGRPAMAWYRDLRLEVGHRMVCGSALALGEIGRATGFASAAHFSTAYRARYGRSPRAARLLDRPPAPPDGGARLTMETPE